MPAIAGASMVSIVGAVVEGKDANLGMHGLYSVLKLQ
jgi:hypothetical protein